MSEIKQIHHVMVVVVGALCVTTTSAADDNWYNDFIGPVVTTDDGRTVSAAAEYWTGVVGVPFDRDIELHVPPTPLDLDLDRTVDTTFSIDVKLKGGLLANPQVAGFVATPNDPKGTVGQYSISTGFLGVREEMDPASRKGTGRYGFNCWVCHAGADDRGKILIGSPNTRINLGLIFASSSVMNADHVIREPGKQTPIAPEVLRKREHLDDSFDFDQDDDHRVTISEWRKTMRMPPANVGRALMLLAGPGRLDQSVDQRMDGFIPLANLQQYWFEKLGAADYLRRARQPKIAAFNPVSIPSNLPGLGVKHYSWSGKDSSMKFDAVDIALKAMNVTGARLADLLHFTHGETVDHELLNRALTLDFRNVGTSGRETDSNAANGWTTRMLTRPTVETVSAVPTIYGAARLRDILTHRDHGSALNSDDPLVVEGRRIFTDEIVGEILNQRVVYGREALLPPDAKSVAALVPLDRSRPITERISVRCATCHNHSPARNHVPLSARLSPMQRCDLCHFDHPDPDVSKKYFSLDGWLKTKSLTSVEGCLECHETHPDFGPQVFSNSWLLPFDANNNGETVHDERADELAGGIGTDAMLNIDSLFVHQLLPAKRRHGRTTYAISRDAMHREDNLKYSTAGAGFVRVAPLLDLRHSAPYLHNGSVPTLRALLDPDDERPRRFRVGDSLQAFELDTTMPGNHNSGHLFGTNLSDSEKAALIRFLESID